MKNLVKWSITIGVIFSLVNCQKAKEEITPEEEQSFVPTKISFNFPASLTSEQGKLTILGDGPTPYEFAQDVVMIFSISADLVESFLALASDAQPGETLEVEFVDPVAGDTIPLELLLAVGAVANAYQLKIRVKSEDFDFPLLLFDYTLGDTLLAFNGELILRMPSETETDSIEGWLYFNCDFIGTEAKDRITAIFIGPHEYKGIMQDLESRFVFANQEEFTDVESYDGGLGGYVAAYDYAFDPPELHKAKTYVDLETGDGISGLQMGPDGPDTIGCFTGEGVETECNETMQDRYEALGAHREPPSEDEINTFQEKFNSAFGL